MCVMRCCCRSPIRTWNIHACRDMCRWMRGWQQQTLKLAMSDESFLDRRRAINRRAAAKSRRRLKEHASRVKSVILSILALRPVSTTAALRVASDSERYVAICRAIALRWRYVARHIATPRCEKGGDILHKVTKVPHNFRYVSPPWGNVLAPALTTITDPFNILSRYATLRKCDKI